MRSKGLFRLPKGALLAGERGSLGRSNHTFGSMKGAFGKNNEELVYF